MAKIETMTPEQEARMKPFAQEMIQKAFTHKKIDKDAAASFMQWGYSISKLHPFKECIIVQSPLGAQLMANLLSANVGDNVGANVGDNVWDNVWANVRANVRDNVGDNVRANVRDNVGDNVGDNVWDNGLKWHNFGSYANWSDFGWVSHYLFIQNELGLDMPESFKMYSKYIDLGIYDTIQFKEAVILVEGPLYVKTRASLPHCEDGPSIEFGDGYKLFHWKGVSVPEKLIVSPELVTSEDILKETNAEVRRCFREKMGAEAYYNALTNGDGYIVLDEDTDNQGEIMRLCETKEVDALIGKKVQFIQVVCPSTKRSYDMYPPNQQSKNVWDAKYSTFPLEKGETLYARHGDIGIVQIGVSHAHPVFET